MLQAFLRLNVKGVGASRISMSQMHSLIVDAVDAAHTRKRQLLILRRLH